MVIRLRWWPSGWYRQLLRWKLWLKNSIFSSSLAQSVSPCLTYQTIHLAVTTFPWWNHLQLIKLERFQLRHTWWWECRCGQRDNDWVSWEEKLAKKPCAGAANWGSWRHQWKSWNPAAFVEPLLGPHASDIAISSEKFSMQTNIKPGVESANDYLMLHMFTFGGDVMVEAFKSYTVKETERLKRSPRACAEFLAWKDAHCLISWMKWFLLVPTNTLTDRWQHFVVAK